MPLLLNKPVGLTSYMVVGLVKRALQERTVGHAGTLDPLASGLMIVLVGRAETKQQDQFMGHDKEYVATLQLGATSTTYDLEGEIHSFGVTTWPSLAAVTEVVSSFVGEYHQTVPAHSAVKQGGRKLYDLARRGQITADQLPQRLVRIISCEVISYNAPELTIRVTCGKGTYIRSLADDIGKRLEIGAYLSGLVRTKIGEYSLGDATPLADWVKPYGLTVPVLQWPRPAILKP